MRMLFFSSRVNPRISLFVFFSFIILVAYQGAFSGYFQSDEWHFFNVFLPYTKSWGKVISVVWEIVTKNSTFNYLPHLTPISYFLWVVSMKLFGQNFLPYIATSVFLHVVNSVLVTCLAKEFFDKWRDAIVAGIFFALSAVHFQSVTWVSNHLWTSLSVTFFLLAFLQFLEALKSKGDIARSTLIKLVVYMLLAFLTKESTVSIIPIFVLYLLWHLPELSWRDIFMKKSAVRTIMIVIFITGMIYMPLRISFLPTQASVMANIPLVAFRVVTYPLKIISEVFIPYEHLRSIVEELTPLAYPSYGAERSVRGTTFLTFTQSAGIDMLAYPLGLMIICWILFQLMDKEKTREHKVTLITGMSIIIFSAIILLSIASFAPAAAYVSYFESRHYYLPSVGASLLFVIFLQNLTFTLMNFARKYLKMHMQPSIILFICVTLWIMYQAPYLQYWIKFYSHLGTQRQTLVSTILKSLPHRPSKTMFYIRSNSSYYGYGSYMPPFETNFGQVLTVQYNQRQNLDDYFLDTRYLTSKGLLGEGYMVHGDEVFGYFISMNKLMKSLEDSKAGVESVYAYEWDDSASRARDISSEVRQEIRNTLSNLSVYSTWQKTTFSDINMSLRTPPETQFSEIIDPTVLKKIEIKTTAHRYIMQITKRVYNIGIFEDVSLMENSDGGLIKDDFFYRSIHLKNGLDIIAKIPSKGEYAVYFLPTIFPDKIVSIHVPGETVTKDEGIKELEEIITWIQYPESE